MHIVIGCPIFEREWVLPRWLQSVFNQGLSPGDISFVFGITDGEDNTRELVEKYGDKVRDTYIIDCNDQVCFRDRNPARFYPLAEIRNRMLAQIQEINPDYYFSWDSDIMLPENALKQLVEDDKDIVSPWVELVPGIPNCVSLIPNTRAFRRNKPIPHYYPKGELYPVDICFACVLMKPVAYGIMYEWHQGGEDYGWGLNLLEAGIQCWMDSRIEGHHIFNKDV